MDCNKEEAIRTKAIAADKMQSEDYFLARKLLIQAHQLFPELEGISKMLSICEVQCSSEVEIKGEKNLYAILQIEQHADIHRIKKQYKNLALQVHPDRNNFFGAEAAFKLVVNAYAVLSDTEKRKMYDMKVGAVLTTNPPAQYSNRSYQQPTEQNLLWVSCRHCTNESKFYRDESSNAMHCGCCNRLAITIVEHDISAGGSPSSQPWTAFLFNAICLCGNKYNFSWDRINRVLNCEVCFKEDNIYFPSETSCYEETVEQEDDDSSSESNRSATDESSEQEDDASSVELNRRESDQGSDRNDDNTVVDEESGSSISSEISLRYESSEEEEDDQEYLCPTRKRSRKTAMPDSDHYKTSESMFAVGQIWSAFDDFDAMPRSYVLIKDIDVDCSSLTCSYIKPKLKEECEIRKLPVCCGELETGEDVVLDMNTLCHEVCLSRGEKANSYVIYPRKGEVWALFKDIGGSTDATNNVQFKYEIVEIVEDFTETMGTSGINLIMIEGSSSSFAREVGGASHKIPPSEVFRFSHIVREARNSINSSLFELDIACLPFDLDQYYPSMPAEADNTDEKQSRA